MFPLKEDAEKTPKRRRYHENTRGRRRKRMKKTPHTLENAVFLTLDDDDKKIQNLTVSEKKILHIRARRAQAGVLMELKN